jgi:hypothetical protein
LSYDFIFEKESLRVFCFEFFPVHNEPAKVILNSITYLEAIGYSSFPEREREVTRQKDSMNKIFAEVFQRSSFDKAKWA